ncbi:ABC transporter ATP-binding protein [Candidatus Pseudothioglobus singularis]|nr:ABC transporter ATP-binding protein [Candidatus Pseudothioglobus singularis]
MAMIDVHDIDVGYSNQLIIENLRVSIPEKKITTIIGPNGCGKSTLIKTIGRILKAKRGAVFLDGKSMNNMDTKEIAKQMALLPQTAEAPGGLTVFELVSYGRFPYRKGMGSLSKEDYKYIHWAIDVTGLNDLKDRPTNALSGGQRQRAWIAMALAQGTDILVLDEPTTYLDLAHQLDILLLLKRLNEEEDRTIVMVLHDLNHASRFSDYMIAMRDGEVVSEGDPQTVMTRDNLRKVFQIEADLTVCPYSGNPIYISYHRSLEERETAHPFEKKVLSEYS